jgi:hypothetical protein
VYSGRDNTAATIADLVYHVCDSRRISPSFKNLLLLCGNGKPVEDCTQLVVVQPVVVEEPSKKRSRDDVTKMSLRSVPRRCHPHFDKTST